MEANVEPLRFVVLGAALRRPDHPGHRGRVSGSTGFCLDVPGAQITPGLQLQTWRCNGTLAQQFWVVQ